MGGVPELSRPESSVETRSRRTSLFLPRAVALAVAAGLVLASCSSGENPANGSSAPTSGSPSPSSTASVPAGVALTDPGSKLSFGDPARVQYEPDQKRGTVLRLTVKKAVEGSVKDLSTFILDAKARRSSYYYVHVAVKNLGASDIGGSGVPLWGVNAEDTLLPPVSFTTAFPRCNTKKLPSAFKHGDRFRTCLVYQVPDHGPLRAVSFRPDQASDPIRWTGKIA